MTNTFNIDGGNPPFPFIPCGIDILLERFFGGLVIYRSITPLFGLLTAAMLLTLVVNETTNVIYKVLNLILLSLLVITTGMFYAEMLFLFIVYIIAFIGAIIMLFLSVVLMLPASVVRITSGFIADRIIPLGVIKPLYYLFNPRKKAKRERKNKYYLSGKRKQRREWAHDLIQFKYSQLTFFGNTQLFKISGGHFNFTSWLGLGKVARGGHYSLGEWISYSIQYFFAHSLAWPIFGPAAVLSLFCGIAARFQFDWRDVPVIRGWYRMPDALNSFDDVDSTDLGVSFISAGTADPYAGFHKVQSLLGERAMGTPSIFNNILLFGVLGSLLIVYTCFTRYHATNIAFRLYRSLRNTQREQQEYELFIGQIERLETHREAREFLIRHLKRTRVRYIQALGLGYTLLTTLEDVGDRADERKVQKKQIQDYMNTYKIQEVETPETRRMRALIYLDRDEETERLDDTYEEEILSVSDSFQKKLESQYYTPGLRALRVAQGQGIQEWQRLATQINKYAGLYYGSNAHLEDVGDILEETPNTEGCDAYSILYKDTVYGGEGYQTLSQDMLGSLDASVMGSLKYGYLVIDAEFERAKPTAHLHRESFLEKISVLQKAIAPTFQVPALLMDIGRSAQAAYAFFFRKISMLQKAIASTPQTHPLLANVRRLMQFQLTAIQSMLSNKFAKVRYHTLCWLYPANAINVNVEPLEENEIQKATTAASELSPMTTVKQTIGMCILGDLAPYEPEIQFLTPVTGGDFELYLLQCIAIAILLATFLQRVCGVRVSAPIDFILQTLTHLGDKRQVYCTKLWWHHFFMSQQNFFAEFCTKKGQPYSFSHIIRYTYGSLCLLGSPTLRRATFSAGQRFFTQLSEFVCALGYRIPLIPLSVVAQAITLMTGFFLAAPIGFHAQHFKGPQVADHVAHKAEGKTTNELQAMKHFLYETHPFFLIIGVLILLVALVAIAIQTRALLNKFFEPAPKNSQLIPPTSLGVSVENSYRRLPSNYLVGYYKNPRRFKLPERAKWK